ncbi:MAG: glucose-6-phosphate isomerase [Bacilli bacterium]|jgi:glucose-6-phosphate isomerase
MIKFDFKTYTKKFITKEDFKKYKIKEEDVLAYFKKNKEMMGWYQLSSLFSPSLIKEIKKTSLFIQNNCEVFLVVGIGGSYLGAVATIEALKPYFYNQKEKPEIYFLGTNLASDYYSDLIDLIKDKEIIINVISKSGGTLEPSLAYQQLLKLMEKKYSKEELKKRIILTTDQNKGSLREDVKKYGYQSFVIPSDIGGRFSVFSPGGLLPIAVAGLNLEKLYEGAKEANKNLDKEIEYALIRKIMYDQGKVVEAYVVYEPKLRLFTEWLKQLYGESLGKEEQGILSISLLNTGDLHSLGQFVQEGSKILFETVINIETSNSKVKSLEYNLTMNEINQIARKATSLAHYNGNVLNNIIQINKLDEYSFGYLLEFFMVSSVISGYLEKVNPFNQEGVEEYKRIMKGLLLKDKED